MQEHIFTEPLMGTSLHLSIIDTDANKANVIAKEILEIGHDYEKTFSRFDAQSELSVLNAKGEGRVSDLLYEAVEESKHAKEITQGAFNPLYSPFYFGYGESFEKGYSTASVPIETIVNGDIECDPVQKIIRLPKGSRLDLGGMVKGWFAEKMAKQYAHTVHGILVNAGGDIAAWGHDVSKEYFSISIRNPITQAPIPLQFQNAVVCTSGTYKRSWGEYHHIISPFTETPAKTDIVSATVVHPKGSVAEALATASIIWGKEESIRFFSAHGILWIGIEQNGNVTYTSIQNT